MLRSGAPILFILLTLSAHSQKFADKNYYLVDSLIYDNIAPYYQVLIDTNLEVYHRSETVMQKVNAINLIVKLCWDENVWPKYNQWVYNFTSESLKQNQPDDIKFQLKQAQAGALYYIGWNYGVATQYDKCIFYYEQCKTIYIEIADSIGIANTLDNIGNIFMIQGDLAKALDYFKQALVIRELVGDNLGIGASRNSIGGVYFEHGDYLSALKEFKQALVIHKKVNFISGVSTALNNLGAIELFFGNYDNALNYYTHSLEISTQLGDKQSMAMSMCQIGSIKFIQHDYKEAMTRYKTSIALYADVDDQRGIAGCYQSMGQVFLAKKKYKKAIFYFEKSLAIATEKGIAQEKKNALEFLFYTFLLQENLVEAENQILEIIDLRNKDVEINFSILPEQKKELYLATMSTDFMNLFAFASIRKETNPTITIHAYNNALKLKGLLLKSTAAMRQRILSSGNKELLEMYNNWMSLKKEIAYKYSIGEKTETLENKANTYEAELIKISSKNGTNHLSEMNSWTQVQESLKEDEIAIEFVHFNSQIGVDTSTVIYASLLVTKNCKQPIMTELCDESELIKILGTTQTNNINYIQSVYGTKSIHDHRIYELVWQPLESHLTSIKTIYFSPTGVLHKISFNALANQKNELLCDKFELIQVGSTSQINQINSSRLETNNTISLFGGVKYSNEKTKKVIWNYLPGSLAEVDSIYTKLKEKMNVSMYSGENANEENFKSQTISSHIIHIASHGFFYPDPELIQRETYVEEKEENLDFRGGRSNYVLWNFVNNKNPLMRSGIALARANNNWDRSAFEEGEDGILTAQEVTSLNLNNTELVVLSACETGLGDIKGTEGVYGLQRAFKMAGVKNLIISLWQVPDDETAEFMIRFYTLLSEGKTIRQSFAETQHEMRKKYDPYFWAAFILVE